MTRRAISLTECDGMPNGITRARGVTLRRREGGAGGSKSLELLVFLSGVGAIWASAPGAGGAKSRFGGATEPMTWSDISLYKSPRRLYIKEADVIEDHLAVRKTHERLSTAISWHSAIARQIPLLAPNDSLLSLLFGSMKNLSIALPPSACSVRFFWKWANIWGCAPDLERCDGCGEIFSDRKSMMTDIGLLCPNCAREAFAFGSFDEDERKAMLRAAREPRGAFVKNANDICALMPIERWIDAYSWLEKIVRL